MSEEFVISGRPPMQGYKTEIASGFGLAYYDYVALAQASTTDTYTFKSGGSGGVLVGTITITYTDSTKGTISTVIKT